MSETKKAVIRSFVKSVNAQDWDSLRNLLVPHFVRHSNAGGVPEVRSAEELITFLKNEYVTFPDAEETLLDLVAEGESVAARCHFRGTQLGSMGSFPPLGKVLSATYLAIYRLEEGRIAEAWAEWDNLYGLQQLGHLKAT
jgi:predicted ester cyclase